MNWRRIPVLYRKCDSVLFWNRSNMSYWRRYRRRLQLEKGSTRRTNEPIYDVEVATQFRRRFHVETTSVSDVDKISSPRWVCSMLSIFAEYIQGQGIGNKMQKNHFKKLILISPRELQMEIDKKRTKNKKRTKMEKVKRTKIWRKKFLLFSTVIR